MVMLAKIFFDLCLLRANPQDLPPSSFLLGIMLLAYTLTGIGVAATGLPLFNAVLAACIGTLILVMLTHTALLIRKTPARLPQTLTALAGTGAIIGVIAWPLSAAQGPLALLIALVIWSIAVTAHILRHALSLSLRLSIGVSLGYLLISFIIESALFGPPS